MRSYTIHILRFIQLAHSLLPLVFAGLYVALVVFFIRNYFIPDAITLCSMLAIPLLIRVNDKQTVRLRFFWFSVFMLLLASISGVATFYFLAAGLAVLFAIESMAGRIGWVPVFLLGLVCPAFKYFNHIFGFSVRLKLSELSGAILNMAGLDVEVSGNIMTLGNAEFSVDPACAGLKMMAVSLLAGLLMLAFFERKYSRIFSFLQVLIVMVAIILFNVLGNLFRIVLLVIFEILPENPAHDITGVLCLILYVLVPAYFSIRYLARQAFKNPAVPVFKRSRKFLLLSGLHMLLFLMLLVTGIGISGKSPASAKTVSISIQNGYTRSLLENKVTKLEKPGILIYIKPVERFYGAEHNPMICWVGSGYEFTRIKTKSIEGREIFTGTLQKGNDKIYAAWWFDSGTSQTANQLSWRWKAFKGEKFNLVNVNSASEKVLEEEVRNVLR